MSKNNVYQFSIIVCSLMVVVMTIMQLTMNLSPETNQVFNVLDVLMWLFFLIDYIYRLMKSEHKIRFIKENKIDVLTIIPYFSAFRLLRLIRVVEVMPLFRFM